MLPMSRKITRRKFLKRTVYTTALAAGGGYVGYQLFKRNHIDDLYGPYPDASKLKMLSVENPGAPKPNIIYICCDDLGYGDLGCYGGRVIRTPNADRLAVEGTRFTDYCVCNSVCAPSRAGFLTGRYAFRTGVIGNPYPEKEPVGRRLARRVGAILRGTGAIDLREDYVARGLSQKEITIAEALKLAGYKTGMVGKWHLGDYSQEPAYNPLRHGFDSYFGVPHSNDMIPCPLFKDDKMLEADIGTNQARITGLYTREAKAFIKRSKDAPFFLYLAHTFPHQPLYASKKFDRQSKAGKFGDVVEELDWSLGEILNCLKENGLEESTLIFFTSDNGPWYEGSAGHFRGRKGQTYEGGFRVPCIARWPGKIPQGETNSVALMNIDLFPTFLTLAGVRLPEDRIIDGCNIFNHLAGIETASPHEALYFYHYDLLEGVRSGNWKYIRKTNRYVWPIAMDTAWLPDTLGKKQMGNRWPLLYDLERDPSEAYNVIHTYPDVAEKLSGMMTAWEEKTSKNPRGFKV
jgi:arylsulfatase A-like enzyme